MKSSTLKCFKAFQLLIDVIDMGIFTDMFLTVMNSLLTYMFAFPRTYLTNIMYLIDCNSLISRCKSAEPVQMRKQ